LFVPDLVEEYTVRLQEYQSKSLFAKHGIPIPRGRVASTPEQARQFAEELGGAVAVKAQVLVGGRGKAGGIRLASTPAEAEEAASAILGMQVRGLPVRQLLLEEAVGFEQEIYLGIVVDRSSRQAVMMASAEGGVEIEQVARDHPEAIVKVAIDPSLGLSSAQTLSLAEGIGFGQRPDELYHAFDAIARGLYEVFLVRDALLAEINPLVITSEGKLLSLDGKVVIDDNALFRHPDLSEMRDTGEETPAEREARAAGLSYVHLGGEIGCVVNGAGLAMATMDVIKHFGGVPANFLDVGGGANADRVAVALRLVLGTPGIKAVLVNIFGGITLCDEVAQGIVAALGEVETHVPLVVRLVGTNEERGHEILNASGYRLVGADTLAEAARKVVAVAGGELEV
jgi:succinyl-CoA synthetase beta subunit